MGSSPATQPTPNRGNEVMVQQGMSLIIKLMGELVGKAGGASEAAMALMDCIKKLAKFVPQGASHPQAEQEQLRGLAMKQQQMSQMPQQKPPGA